jgi:hypothetical protein
MLGDGLDEALEKEELDMDEERLAMIGFLSFEWKRTWMPWK